MEKKLAIIASLDFVNFSKQSKSKAKEIKKFASDTITSIIERQNNRKYSFADGGDGYFITIYDEEIVYFIDFIIEIIACLKILNKNYTQYYRIGADFGIIELKYDALIGAETHFNECGIGANRLEQGAKSIHVKNTNTILVSENIFNLFNEFYTGYFSEKIEIDCKDRKLAAYRFKTELVNELLSINALKDFFSNEINLTKFNETYSILIIEDEVPFLRLFKSYLKKTYSGFKIYTARNGLEALNVYNTEKIDLLTVDIIMPGIDGIELIKRIREKDKLVSILICTALVGQYSEVALFKPLNLDELVFYIKSFMELDLIFKKNKPYWLVKSVKSVILNSKYLIYKINSLDSKNYLNEFIKHNAKNLIDELFPSSFKTLNSKSLEKCFSQLKKLYHLSTNLTNVNTPIGDFLTYRAKDINLSYEDINIEINEKEHVSELPSHINSIFCLVAFELIENAVQVVKHKENKTISIEFAHLLTENKIIMKVKNAGEKIKNVDKIFEKGFTTRENGTGIGLFLAKKALMRFDGDIQYDYKNSQNVFIVTCPTYS